MPLIGHVRHGAYQKLYQLRAYVFRCRILTLIRFFGTQGVAPSSRENVRRHAREAEGDRMHVDDVPPTRIGTFPILS